MSTIRQILRLESVIAASSTDRLGDAGICLCVRGWKGFERNESITMSAPRPGLPTNCIREHGYGGTQRSPPGAQATSRAVLSGPENPWPERAGGDGSQRTCALVRAFAERTAV